MLGGGIVAALLVVGLAVWLLPAYLGGGSQTLEIPSLEGQTLEEARKIVGGDFEISGDGDPRGTIQSQKPGPGERAERGSEISVVLGAGTAQVPDVGGKTQAEAEEVLRSAGFDAKAETRESSEEEDGTVLEQNPAAGDEAEKGSAVGIVVGEAPRPAPGYALVTDGPLSVEAPVGWQVSTGADSEGAGSGWSSFLGESVGASITAAPDLAAWYNSGGTTGMYVVASRTLAQGYTNEQLVVSGPNDLSSACTLGDAQDFQRDSYPARIQAWTNCDGNPEVFFFAVAVAPEDRACAVVMQIGAVGKPEQEIAQHIIDTFEVDCAGIAESGTQSKELASAHAPAG